MFKQTITFEDYNGKERTKDLYFNLSKKEINDFGLNGFTEKIERIQKEIEEESYNRNELVDMYLELIIKAYGEKAEDGMQFIKSKEMTEAFTQSCVFEALVDKLLEDEEFSNNFVLGILPKKLAEEASKKLEEQGMKLN